MDVAAGAVFLLLFSALPSAIDSIARFQDCGKDVEGGYLRPEPSVSCFSPEYASLSTLAKRLGYFYLVLPVGIGAVLMGGFRDPSASQPQGEHQHRSVFRPLTDGVSALAQALAVRMRGITRFLWAEYDVSDPTKFQAGKGKYFAWECLVLLRKAAFTGISSGFLVLQDSRSQLTATVILLLVAVVAHAKVWPYRDPAVNRLELVALAAQLLVCCCLWTRVGLPPGLTGFDVEKALLPAAEQAFFDIVAAVAVGAFLLLWLITALRLEGMVMAVLRWMQPKPPGPPATFHQGHVGSRRPRASVLEIMGQDPTFQPMFDVEVNPLTAAVQQRQACPTCGQCTAGGSTRRLAWAGSQRSLLSSRMLIAPAQAASAVTSNAWTGRGGTAALAAAVPLPWSGAAPANSMHALAQLSQPQAEPMRLEDCSGTPAQGHVPAQPSATPGSASVASLTSSAAARSAASSASYASDASDDTVTHAPAAAPQPQPPARPAQPQPQPAQPQPQLQLQRPALHAQPPRTAHAPAGTSLVMVAQHALARPREPDLRAVHAASVVAAVTAAQRRWRRYKWRTRLTNNLRSERRMWMEGRDACDNVFHFRWDEGLREFVTPPPRAAVPSGPVQALERICEAAAADRDAPTEVSGAVHQDRTKVLVYVDGQHWRMDADCGRLLKPGWALAPAAAESRVPAYFELATRHTWVRRRARRGFVNEATGEVSFDRGLPYAPLPDWAPPGGAAYLTGLRQAPAKDGVAIALPQQ
jgi:hypothetical protein